MKERIFFSKLSAFFGNLGVVDCHLYSSANHRDMKPENMLVEELGYSTMELKRKGLSLILIRITDIGMGKIQSEADKALGSKAKQSNCGTSRYNQFNNQDKLRDSKDMHWHRVDSKAITRIELDGVLNDELKEELYHELDEFIDESFRDPVQRKEIEKMIVNILKKHKSLHLRDLVVPVALSQNDTIYTLYESDNWDSVIPMARDILLKEMGPDAYKQKSEHNVLFTSLERRFRTICKVKDDKYDFRLYHTFEEMNEQKEPSNESQNSPSAQRAGGIMPAVPFYEHIVVVCDVVCCQCLDNDVTHDDEWKIGEIVEVYSVSAGGRWCGGKITNKFTDQEGEWLEVWYCVENKGESREDWHQKEIPDPPKQYARRPTKQWPGAMFRYLSQFV